MWISHDFQGGICKLRKIDRGFQQFFDIPLIFIERLKIVFQGFLEAFLAK